MSIYVLSAPNSPFSTDSALMGLTLSISPLQQAWCCYTFISRGHWRDSARGKGHSMIECASVFSSSCCCAMGTKTIQWYWVPVMSSKQKNPQWTQSLELVTTLLQLSRQRHHAPSCQWASYQGHNSHCPPTSLCLPSALRGVSCLASVRLRPKSSVFCGQALVWEKVSFSAIHWAVENSTPSPMRSESQLGSSVSGTLDTAEEVVWHKKKEEYSIKVFLLK